MNKQPCNVCYAKKVELSECNKCRRLACGECIPAESPTKYCIPCIRQEIRDMLILENLEKCKTLEKEISNLHDSAQHHQQEIEKAADEEFIKKKHIQAIEDSHEEKVRNLEMSIDKAKLNVIPYTTIDNLEKALEDAKVGERLNKIKYQELVNAVEAEESELKSLRETEKMSEERIKELRLSASTRVPYEMIRGVCNVCTPKIKLKFADIICAANLENKSILQSILNTKTQQIELERRKSRGNYGVNRALSSGSLKSNREDKCGCGVF